MQRRKEAAVEVVPAQLEDRVVRIDLGVQHVVDHLARIDAVVDVMERRARHPERLDGHGPARLPVDDLLPARAEQRVERRIRAAPLVRRVRARDARVDVDDPPAIRRAGAHEFVEDHEQPVEHDEIGAERVERLAQARLERALARRARRRRERLAPVLGRNREQQIVDEAALHAQRGRIEPALAGLVREAVLGELLAVERRARVVVVDHALERIRVAELGVVQCVDERFEHRFHVARAALVVHLLPRLVGGGVSERPDVDEFLLCHRSVVLSFGRRAAAPPIG
ncbi:Uncharacterised protein [Burkholderia pseudomallei]|nr:Uncharacterised protein [Burkholderia pseudomallei]